MKFVDIKENTSPTQKLLLIVMLLILLAACFYGFRSLTSNKGIIDYKIADSNYFIFNSEETTDRDVYWNLEEILSKYLGSYQSEYNNEVENVEYYYNSLDNNYKKFLGKKKYIEISNNIIQKMVGDTKEGMVSLPAQIIKNVYKVNIDNNMYLCKLNTLDENDNAHVGIILNTERKEYSIFYIN